MIYWELFLGFLKVGCFTFGGAYSAIPLIREVVLSAGWLSDETLTHMIAISESTPGPIMVNLATYVGNTMAGLWGAVLATLAVVLPSFLIILLIMSLMKNLLKNKYVQAVLRGVKPCIIGVILATGAYMTLHHCFPLQENAAVDLPALGITAALVALSLLYRRLRAKKLSPILLIVLSAALGMIVYAF
ncbi:MAG: chromate transporter [Eubacteriales bacterium]|nr:chromate transporter [Eubacteriales bacterium]